MSGRYTDIQIVFLESICRGNTYKEITQAFNYRFNTKKTPMAIQHKLKALGLDEYVSKESRYTEQQLTFLYVNKQLSWAALTKEYNKKFSEEKTIDAIRAVMTQNGWGKYHTEARKDRRRIYINGSQMMLDRYVWECVHGPIPDGYTVVHLDNDTANNKIDNLKLAPKHIKLAFVAQGGTDAPKALAPAMYAKVMLQNLIGRIEKSGRLNAR
ncbi:HNH endonuclease signature motif containing protein [Serratia fonticola]|uniref:HNH endonuclease n=1 Tax=Serratia fonticola TaxID=47917 RepID=A0AAW3WR37_SERFO|nr:HNH endonuclease signature motif containing protein [Serratia fonticola]MBC3213418.1 HNH endonuclease [Serratia fonticola]NYA14277.1 HNH endonuclease [Serratia fonticola]NYA33919.1 HNH endonuclease [Serratia fonticola]